MILLEIAPMEPIREVGQICSPVTSGGMASRPLRRVPGCFMEGTDIAVG
jgi:hypothetical protein